jgi:hypothetical protein
MSLLIFCPWEVHSLRQQGTAPGHTSLIRLCGRTQVPSPNPEVFSSAHYIPLISLLPLQWVHFLCPTSCFLPIWEEALGEEHNGSDWTSQSICHPPLFSSCSYLTLQISKATFWASKTCHGLIQDEPSTEVTSQPVLNLSRLMPAEDLGHSINK